jgi:hypothetical protein
MIVTSLLKIMAIILRINIMNSYLWIRSKEVTYINNLRKSRSNYNNRGKEIKIVITNSAHLNKTKISNSLCKKRL